jgi:hypothetical protein
MQNICHIKNRGNTLFSIKWALYVVLSLKQIHHEKTPAYSLFLFLAVFSYYGCKKNEVTAENPANEFSIADAKSWYAGNAQRIHAAAEKTPMVPGYWQKDCCRFGIKQ